MFLYVRDLGHEPKICKPCGGFLSLNDQNQISVSSGPHPSSGGADRGLDYTKQQQCIPSMYNASL